MGLLLSILVACVGVVELLAFCSNVRRSFVSVSTQTNLADIGKRYEDEFRQRRYLEVASEDIEVEISNALPRSRSPSPRRLLLTETRARSRSPTPRHFVLTDAQDANVGGANLRQFVVEESDSHFVIRNDSTEPIFPLPQQFIVTEPEETRHSPSPIPRRLDEPDSVFRRSASPYPISVLSTPRNSICGDNSNALLPGVEEETISRSPSPEKVRLVETNQFEPHFLDSLDGIRNKKSCRRSRKKKDDNLSSNNDAQTAKTLTEAANVLKNDNGEPIGESSSAGSSKTAEPFWVN